MPARLVPLAVGRTAVAVSGLAESGLVHRLTRGRLWIGALTTLLVGIVAVNVLALSFNATASRTGQKVDVLKRQISTLRAQIAAAGASNQRVQSEAANLGLIVPEPGSISYLTPKPSDAAMAAKRLASGALTLGAPNTAPATPATATTTSASPTAATATAPTSTTTPAAASTPSTTASTTSTTATSPTTATPAPAPAGTPTTKPSTAATSPPPAPSSGGGTAAGGVATP
jgi:hypothetical protein